MRRNAIVDELADGTLIIEEGHPLPDQPPATSERERMPRVTIGALGLTMQAEIGGATIAFERLVDATMGPEDIDAEIDLLIGRIGRQKAKAELAEKLLALEICHDKLASWDSRRTEALRAKADEAVRLRASFEAQNQVAGKRTPEAMSPQQRQALDNIPTNIETERTNFDREKARYVEDERIICMQIERLRALIRGDDPTEKYLAEPDRLAAD